MHRLTKACVFLVQNHIISQFSYLLSKTCYCLQLYGKLNSFLCYYIFCSVSFVGWVHTNRKLLALKIINSCELNYISRIGIKVEKNGRSISFSKSFPVRDPLAFAAAAQNLPQANRQNFRKFPTWPQFFALRVHIG